MSLSIRIQPTAETATTGGKGKRYAISSKIGTLWIHVARSGRRLYAGDRAEVYLMDERSRSTWQDRKRAEQVLSQARHKYPFSDLLIVEVREE